ncbi:hypothetical protein PN498_10955 [Oscillatoria sp. CS-180]|uniref:COG1470 family protein n=1 Tax=Oscillatoria sp. CS-180 TaxID=3021720 RepID=UPI00232CEABF|nr:hypothetical protein [Oscillatoria sp. CS-180]MDB9526509.1 hypothetical protein [Oscillatoria sp. CS-180]
MVVSNSLHNLRLDIQGSTLGAKSGSDPVERVITIQNRGQEIANVELWLKPTDAQSEPLLQWSLFDKSDAELTLEPDERIDVTLSFLIPLQAEPGFYSYEIRLRSPQYPNEDLRRSQQLQVLPSAQEVRLRNEPKITLDPVTDSDHPYQLQAGGTFAIAVTVENPSRRTDRFFLTCPDLDDDWYSVIYPENTAIAAGKLSYTDGLELNPGEQGIIRCQIHPPQHAPAGHYFPLLRLHSKVRTELMLLKVVYFVLVVSDRLTADLTPKVQSLPSPDPGFQLALTNQGNIQRQLWLEAWDVERQLQYRFTPAEVSLAPGEEKVAGLTLQPRRWWHRIWRLRDRDIDFEVLVDNLLSQPIGETDDALQPALPEPVTGKVLYKAQRRWLFRLLVLILGLGAALTLLWLIWEFFIWRPSLKPSIVEFSTPQETYKEEGEPITFSWEITNPERITRLVLSPKDVQINGVDDVVYRLNDSAIEGNFPLTDDSTTEGASSDIEILLPPDLDNANCTLEETKAGFLSPLLKAYRWLLRKPLERQSLNCQVAQVAGLATETRTLLEEGKYAFELEVFWDRQLRTAATTQGSSEEARSQRLRLPGRAPAADRSASADRLADRAVLPDVVIAAPDLPKILAFSTAATDYQVADGNAPTAVNEADQPTATGASAVPAIAPVQLDWTIANPSEIQAIQVFGLAPDGSVNAQPITFEFVEGQLPSGLLPYCSSGTTGQLQCENVPTTATKVGEYTFYLRVIAGRDGTVEAIAEQAPMVAIKPLAPIINSFQVDGNSALEQPRQVYSLNPNLETFKVLLSWEIENATKIELSPAPGEIEGDSIVYTLSASPGAETIELRVTNEAGEVATRSVVIEKTEAFMPELALPFGAPGEVPPPPPPPGSAGAAGNPLPPALEGLEPVGAPPQAD